VNLALLLLQIAVILGACWLVRKAVVPLQQPPVMGEIIAGLLLGPSFLGWIAPGWYAQLFPPASLPALNGLSQIGLVIFMFLVGLRLDLSEVRAFRHVAGLSAVLSVVLPFVLGLLFSSRLYALAPPSSARLPFALFIAVSMSITAFPVLARILTDRGLTKTRLGHVAISCAAFDDVIAWCMLAAITSIVRAGAGQSSLYGPAVTVLVYAIVMFGPVRIGLRSLSARYPVAGELPLILVFVFLSSWITESIGIHALFGAFVAGVIWPREAIGVTDLAGKLEPAAMSVLIPLFFSYTGIRTNIGLLGSGNLWMYEIAILTVAVAGKAGGAFTGARVMGFSLRESVALGCLLNTRGLVELVVLNVGLDLGILSPVLFSMMVLMALITTLMAAPVLRWVLPPVYGERDRPVPARSGH
jgi:Kef-type K+ transport system membrane component KefB